MAGMSGYNPVGSQQQIQQGVARPGPNMTQPQYASQPQSMDQFKMQNQPSQQMIQQPIQSPQLQQMQQDTHLQQLQEFWREQTQEVQRVDDFKNHQLPLARIKKIMKSDEDVRMISAEAPVLFSKACEMFILELTLRSWIHTEENKRRTLQRNDIAAAISKTDIFDFLIDIVPREEVKPPSKPKEEVATATAMATLAGSAGASAQAVAAAAQAAAQQVPQQQNRMQPNVIGPDQMQYYMMQQQAHMMRGGYQSYPIQGQAPVFAYGTSPQQQQQQQQQQQSHGISLTDVLTPDSLIPHMSDDRVRSTLLPFLPESSPHTSEELHQVVRSPQFRTLLDSLNSVLHSPHRTAFLSNLGLNPGLSIDGVEGFLRAIQNQVDAARVVQSQVDAARVAENASAAPPPAPSSETETTQPPQEDSNAGDASSTDKKESSNPPPDPMDDSK